MRISSIFVLASRLKEDTEESKRHHKKADSEEGFEIILFDLRLQDSPKNGCGAFLLPLFFLQPL